MHRRGFLAAMVGVVVGAITGRRKAAPIPGALYAEDGWTLIGLPGEWENQWIAGQVQLKASVQREHDKQLGEPCEKIQESISNEYLYSDKLLRLLLKH